MTIRFATFAAAALIGLAAVFPAAAGEQPNLMIVGEDADTDTVPRNNRVFNRVLRAISAEMQAKGFKVYDETAVTMGITNPGRVRRADAELITVAKRVQGAPIDAITVFQIYASAEKNPYADIIDLRVRIPGRMLHVQTGRALGNYEVAYGPGDLPPLPVNCKSDCVLEHVGAQAKRIAADVGAVLAVKLDQLSPARPRTTVTTTVTGGGSASGGAATVTAAAPAGGCTGLTTAYTLTFRGFSSPEVTRIEEYLTAFKGYDHHRPVNAAMTETSYWYESCSDEARLNRNIRLMIEQMGLQARIAKTGNKFDIDNLQAPQTR